MQVVLCLEHEKVSQKECEFHMLQNHSTTTCPDYIIVRYPYMEFTPLADVPKPGADLVLAMTTPPAKNGVVVSTDAVSPSPPTMNGTTIVNGLKHGHTDTQVEKAIEKQSSSPVDNSITTTEPKIKQEPNQDVQMNGSLQQQEESATTANQPTTDHDDINSLTTLQAVNRAKELAEKGLELPLVLRQCIITIRKEMRERLGAAAMGAQ